MHNFSNSFLYALNGRLAFLLAKAGCEVFPGAQVVAIHGTGDLFFADFCFSQNFVDAYVPLIRERLAILIKEAHQILKKEMVASSAKGLLEKVGQDLRAELLQLHPKLLIDVYILDDFAYASEEEIELEEKSSHCFWELLTAVDGGEAGGCPVTRIIGCASKDLPTAKAQKKKWARHPYITPGQLAIQGKFLAPCRESWIWLPRGERIRRGLLQLWQNLAVKEEFHIVTTGGHYPLEQGIEEMLQNLSSSTSGTAIRLAEVGYGSLQDAHFHLEGILTPQKGWMDRLVRICREDRVRNECISSLQSIIQIPRMLSFDTQIVLCSSISGETKILREVLEAIGVDYRWEKGSDRRWTTIEVRISDRLGRFWDGPSLWVEKEKSLPGRRLVFSSCLGKWERFFGLLIEKWEEVELEQFMNLALSKQ